MRVYNKDVMVFNMQTVYCSNLETKAFTQVTPSEIRVISQDGSSLLAAWAVPENDSILAASSNSNMVCYLLLPSLVAKPTCVQKRRFPIPDSSHHADCCSSQLKTGPSLPMLGKRYYRGILCSAGRGNILYRLF